MQNVHPFFVCRFAGTRAQVGDLASPEEAKMAILGSLGQDSDGSHDKRSSEGEHSDDAGGVIGTAAL